MNALIKKLGVVVVVAASMAGGLLAYKSTQYDFKTLNGNTYTWKELDEQWVIINYFAPWCAPCLREMPELNALNNALPENTYLFAINYDRQSVEQMQEMKTRFSIELPLIMSDADTVLPMEKPPYLPATYIIGPSGEVVETVLGEVTAEILKQKLIEHKRAS